MGTELYKGYNIKVEQDENPESPREWDNFGTMACFHKRYNLGDKTDLNSEDFGSWQEMEDYIKKDLEAISILPLYLYDHSGLRIKVGDFYGLLPQGHAEFDSGQVGFIYCTKEDIKNNWGIKKVTKNYLERAETLLRGEVKDYDSYICGDVYGYVITDPAKNDDTEDSCWGYIGNSDACLEEAKRVVDSMTSK